MFINEAGFAIKRQKPAGLVSHRPGPERVSHHQPPGNSPEPSLVYFFLPHHDSFHPDMSAVLSAIHREINAASTRARLRPTPTVVRDRAGKVTVERPELCGDVARAVRAAAAAATAGDALAAARTQTRSGRLYAFGDGGGGSGTGAWTPVAATAVPASDLPEGTALRLVSFNVWFSEYAWARRCDALIGLLLQEEADVVLLQEVTTRCLGRLLADPRVRARFLVSDAGTGATFYGNYGVAMLVRRDLPVVPAITYVELPSRMGRRGLVAGFGDSLAIATVHLESLAQAGTRLRQLALLNRVLAARPHRETYFSSSFVSARPYRLAVLAGDFNVSGTGPFGDADENRTVNHCLSTKHWQDVWLQEHGEEVDREEGISAHGSGGATAADGLTYDTRINTMVRRVTGQPEDRARYDRVLARAAPGSAAAAHSVRVIGRTPLTVADDELVEGHTDFISDHFGLSWEIQL